MPATLTIKPWADPVIDTLGHDPRSRYAETFWLPTLGPTALLLLRHLADRFDRNPDGIELALADTSSALGLGQREARARRSCAPFGGSSSSTSPAKTPTPTWSRCAATCRRSTLGTCAGSPTTCRRHTPNGPRPSSRRRPSRPRAGGARRVAFTLLEQGDDPDHVERVLHAMGFHPALCHESARWAYDRHCEALALVNAAPLAS